jgi:hypothetical protein
VVPAVGTGTVMEDALEPSLGARYCSTAWCMPKSAKKEVCGQSFLLFFIRICGLTNSLCFPMIPMTVSFLPQLQSDCVLGFNYYLCSSRVLVTWIFADALNALSTNVWFNIIFFVLLVVLRLHSWVHLKLCCLIPANK